jgi:hypothetical protein
VDLSRFKFVEGKNEALKNPGQGFLQGFAANCGNQTVPDLEIEMMFWKAYDDEENPGLLCDMLLCMIRNRPVLAKQIADQYVIKPFRG